MNGEDTGAAGKTEIGPTIVIRGKLKSAEDLTVRGRVEAEITSSRALLVVNAGIVKANVQAHTVTVSGVLVGNITTESRTEITAGGRVVGDIRTPRLIVNDGAALSGRVEMDLDGARQPVAESPAIDSAASSAPADVGPHSKKEPPVDWADGEPSVSPAEHVIKDLRVRDRRRV